jgi:metallo-beta-lactamase class B
MKRQDTVRNSVLRHVLVASMAAAVLVARAHAQSSTAEAHQAAAEKAAGPEWAYLVTRVCSRDAARVEQTAQRGAPGRAGGAPAEARGPAPARQAPPRERWYAEPMKVFDNLYFIGTNEHSSWAITTSAGIIVIDALFEYAVVDAVEGGLKKLGLDPANVKYLIVTHGHDDHSGGTKYLQDKYRPKVVMGAKDWDLVERGRSARPTRDIEATDGQEITLGDTTITLFVTPGHTPTTLSLMFQVKDRGVPHMVAEWGGTSLSANSPRELVDGYIRSAVRFHKIVVDNKVDVVFTNHTAQNHTNEKLAALKIRKPGEPHPFVVGPDSVNRWMTVLEECGRKMQAER